MKTEIEIKKELENLERLNKEYEELYQIADTQAGADSLLNLCCECSNKINVLKWVLSES